MKRQRPHLPRRIRFEHLQEKCLSRLGVDMTKEDHEAMVKSVQAGKMEHIRRVSNRVSRFACTHRNIPAEVLYDRNRKLILTIVGRNT